LELCHPGPFKGFTCCLSHSLFLSGLTFHAFAVAFAVTVTERQSIDQKAPPKKKMPPQMGATKRKIPDQQEGLSKRPKTRHTAVKVPPEVDAQYSAVFASGPVEVETFEPYVAAVKGIY
jgi:hypothetical protein